MKMRMFGLCIMLLWAEFGYAEKITLLNPSFESPVSTVYFVCYIVCNLPFCEDIKLAG